MNRGVFKLVSSLVVRQVLCSSGALLGAAVSIVLEQGVSTYYTSQRVQGKYERGEGERERTGVPLFASR